MRSDRWLILLFACLLCGCAPGSGGTDAYKKIVDEYAKQILLQDTDSALYDQVLEDTRRYIEAPSKEALASLRQEVEETSEQMRQAAKGCVPYEADEEYEKLLKDCGIDPEEYKYAINQRSLSLTQYITEMDNLDYYLESMETSDLLEKELFFIQLIHEKKQEILRTYNYCSVNYWFAEWGEEAMPYIQEEILGKLTSFAAEDVPWETDRDAVTKKLDACAERQGRLVDLMAEFAGAEQEALYRMEQALDGL